MTPLASSIPEERATKRASIVLVHGAFVDASGWQPLYDILVAQGYEVLIVQNPAITLQGDVAATLRAIEEAKHPVVLVGHSYGGAVITEAGNAAKVQSLVYLAAFVPDAGESVYDLASQEVPGSEPPPLLPPADGFIRIDPAKFPTAFAADVDPDLTRFMATSQVPWGIEALQGKISEAAWRSKPAYFLLATQDRMIPAEAQAMMAKRADAEIVEVQSSHAVMLSRPQDVAALIATAANNIETAQA